jgi:hypothetical protein
VQIDVKLKTNIFIIGFGIFGSFLPPLGLFSQNQIHFPISMSKTLVLVKYLSRLVLIKHQKLPFSHNQISPP